MNPQNLTEKELETFGHKIEGSVFFRDFCVCCREPIRVPSKELCNDNYCSGCDEHTRMGKPSNLTHLQDYSGPEYDE